jgi:hypothetical protein
MPHELRFINVLAKGVLASVPFPSAEAQSEPAGHAGGIDESSDIFEPHGCDYYKSVSRLLPRSARPFMDRRRGLAADGADGRAECGKRRTSWGPSRYRYRKSATAVEHINVGDLTVFEVFNTNNTEQQ